MGHPFILGFMFITATECIMLGLGLLLKKILPNLGKGDE